MVTSPGAVRSLSPRVRGNQRPSVVEPVGIRSIPARAGEPLNASAQADHVGVYPRACGGTMVSPFSSTPR